MSLLSTIRTIFVKEMREILRDRRTLLLMIGVPVFLYPAMFVLMEQVMLFGRDNLSGQPPRVAVHQEPGVEAPVVYFADSASVVDLVALQGAGPEQVLSGRFDVVLRLDSVGPATARTLNVDLYYDASSERSVRAHTIILEEMSRLSAATLDGRLAEIGLPPEFARPIAVRETSVATARGLGGVALGRVLPMMLVLMTVLGAFHPAIDIAAGERERRTLEPLLTCCAPASAIVAGKYLAVALMAFLAAALNLASMLLTLNAGIFQFAGELGLEFQLPFSAIALTLLLLALLALLFSALFLGIAVQAQSFREAQTMLTPVYIASFLPTIVTMAPGIEFSEGLAFVPIAGVALLFRTLMSGDPVGIEGFIAVASTIFYSALALSFAARSFAREDVLIGSEDAAEVRAGRLPSGFHHGSAVPGPATALLFTGLVGVLFFYAGSGFVRWGEVGILMSQWFLLALPVVLLLRVGRFRWREALAIRPAPPSAFLAALLIIVGGVPIGWLIAWAQLFYLELPEELLAGLQGLLTADNAGRVAWLVLLVVITPAICEEIVFRGVLLQGFLRRYSSMFAIFASSAVFGVFHLSFETVIRLFPTMFLGALVALVATRTMSILPSMMMHIVNNGTALLLVSRPELQGFLVTAGGGPNPVVIAVGVVLLGVGVRMLPPAPARARVEFQRPEAVTAVS